MALQRVWPALVLRPRFSRMLALWTAGTHCLACAACLATPLGALQPVLLAAIAASAAAAAYGPVLRRAPWSVRALIWQPDGAWILVRPSGRTASATLEAGTFVTQSCIVLGLRVGRWRRSHIAICSDALDADQLRQLRQRLRIHGSSAISSIPPRRIA